MNMYFRTQHRLRPKETRIEEHHWWWWPQDSFLLSTMPRRTWRHGTTIRPRANCRGCDLRRGRSQNERPHSAPAENKRTRIEKHHWWWWPQDSFLLSTMPRRTWRHGTTIRPRANYRGCDLRRGRSQNEHVLPHSAPAETKRNKN